MAEEKKESPLEEARRYFSAIRAAVVSNGDVWGDFLACAARNYKYPFQDQLMIYNYRPHATACATLPMWNEPFHRKVKYKTKKIYKLLFDFYKLGLYSPRFLLSEQKSNYSF